MNSGSDADLGQGENGSKSTQFRETVGTEAQTANAPKRRSALQCPRCFSYRAELIIEDGKTPKACCLDCDRVYAVKYRRVTHTLDDPTPDPPSPRKPKPQYHGKAQEDLPPPQPAPTPSELGALTEYVTETIKGGAKAHRAAQREAKRLAAKFGLDFEAQWLMETPWLREWAEGKHRLTGRQLPRETATNCDRPTRLRVRAVVAKRSRFLTFLAVLGSQKAAAKKARIDFSDIAYQLRNDPDFAQQAEVAHAYFVDLLHMRAAQRAIEGDCEPVFWQGIEVGHIRKFDSRLQIEMLRAHMPDKFKTPGKGTTNIDTGDKILVLTEEARRKLMAANRERIMALPDSFDTTPIGEVATLQESEPHETQ